MTISLYKFKDYLEQRMKLPTVQLIAHYIQNFYPPECALFENSMIEDLYSWLLNDPYHRSNSQILKKEILNEVHAFYRKNLLELEWKSLQNSLRSRVIHIHDKKDSLEVLDEYYKIRYPFVRTMSFDKPYTLALILQSDGYSQSFMHSPLYTIQYGKLRPLLALCHLSYDDQMELQPLKMQKIYDENGECTLFSIQKHSIELRRINTRNFQLIEKKVLSSLQEEPSLFFKLKKIENTYIKAKTDPFYQELVHTLQNGYQKLLTQHPEAVPTAEKCMEEARHALNNIYPQDRLLLLLTANIEYYLRKKESTKNLL